MSDAKELCDLELKGCKMILTARSQDGDIVKSYIDLVIRRIFQLDIATLSAINSVECLKNYYNKKAKRLKWYPQEEGL